MLSYAARCPSGIPELKVRSSLTAANGQSLRGCKGMMRGHKGPAPKSGKTLKGHPSPAPVQLEKSVFAKELAAGQLLLESSVLSCFLIPPRVMIPDTL